MSIFQRIKNIIKSEVNSEKSSKKSRFLPNDDTDNGDSSFKAENFVDKKEALYYANLELAPGASLEEIKNAHRRLMKKYHPDRFNDDHREDTANEITKKLNEAYSYFENKYKE